MPSNRGALAAALVVALLAVTGQAKAADEFVVRPTGVADLKSVFATVESVDLARARARIGGTVAELAVDEGSRVARGGRIARIDDPKLRLRERAVNARLQALGSQREQARTEYERAIELRRSGTISQARLDQVQTQLEVVDRELAAMEAEREVVREEMQEGAVLAPTGGRVLQVHVTNGTVVLPGETLATIAAERYILRLHLPERHARFLKEGDVVRVGERGMAAAPASLREGRLRQVYPELAAGRVVADVEVEGLGDFFVGERVRVYVSAGARETFVVPVDYVARRPGYAAVRLKDGPEVVVQTGSAAAGGIEVLSGLRDGDVLVKP
ncbi:MAG: efflux RND transporter periplasmic adaptor subunit [Proteobacteria bacterium]|nr:efflux RND transporter periplasmic adaptor subunit [Pseudomonadota bacterium]